jgi:hypothetical protein
MTDEEIDHLGVAELTNPHSPADNTNTIPYCAIKRGNSTMVALKASTHTLLDGAVKVYRRGNSNHWQATFKIDQHWISVRASGSEHLLEDALLRSDIEGRLP